jgi:hypothetical protein
MVLVNTVRWGGGGGPASSNEIIFDDISLSLLLLVSSGIFITRDFRQKNILPYHDITTKKALQDSQLNKCFMYVYCL